MADDGPIEPELTPTEEQRVRRLLAEARHDQAIPPAVAARLDDVLAGLGAGANAASPRPTEAAPAPVVDLAARRRRRRVTQVLVAAAAVTVVGVTGPQLLNGAGDMMSADSESATSAGGSVNAEEVPEAGSAPQSYLGDDSGDGDGTARAQSPQDAATLPVPMAADTFLRKALRLQQTRSAAALKAEASASELDGLDLGRCRGDATWGTGRRVAVTYEGDDGVLIYRKPSSGRQRVDLFLCGQDAPTRSTVLPTP